MVGLDYVHCEMGEGRGRSVISVFMHLPHTLETCARGQLREHIKAGRRHRQIPCTPTQALYIGCNFISVTDEQSVISRDFLLVYNLRDEVL